MTEILNKAHNLYQKYNTCDPIRLCEYLGITLMYADLPKVTDGIYFQVEKKQIILINQGLSPEKARYTVAHELGHALLHPEQNYMFMAQRTLMKTERYESEADLFSVSLLLCDVLKNNRVKSMTSSQLSKMAGLPEILVEKWKNNVDIGQVSQIFS